MRIGDLHQLGIDMTCPGVTTFRSGGNMKEQVVRQRKDAVQMQIDLLQQQKEQNALIGKKLAAELEGVSRQRLHLTVVTVLMIGLLIALLVSWVSS